MENEMNKAEQQRSIENLLPHNGEAYLFTDVFTNTENEIYLNRLQQEILWEQEPIQMFGKEVMQPRLTAWYGDDGKNYTYSGITMKPLPWTPALLSIKEKTEEICKRTFNSCLLNFYRTGNDSMGWHRDNEKELGENPAIASVSFGAERTFQFRNYENKKEIISITLPSGSVLFMAGTTQTNWQHALPKSKKLTDIRINLTFRNIS
jgi:alkylated DNA repair dioxygenase AlkB